MLFQHIDKALPAHDNTGLRATQQLVAAETNDIHAGADAVHDRRLTVQTITFQIAQAAATQIFNDGQVILLAQLHQFFQGHRLRKAHDFKVAGMHLQQSAGFRANRPLIIINMRFICKLTRNYAYNNIKYWRK